MARTKKKLRCGKGAVCSVLTRMLHPRKDVTDKYANASHNSKVENLTAIRKEPKIVNRKEQVVIVFRHPDFAEVELHCNARFCHVETEGPVSEIFVDGSAPVDTEVQETAPQVDEGMDPVVAVPATTGDIAEDIQNLRAQGFSVDDDNEPAEENIPDKTTTSSNEQTSLPNIYQEWDSRNVCNRKSDGHCEENPRLLKTPSSETRLGYFLLLLPLEYIKTILLPMTSAQLDGGSIKLSEFMRYIGMWLLMSSQVKTAVREYFSSAPIDPYSNGALFRLNDIMSWNRFNAVTKSLKYTGNDPPSYKDKFHGVREMLQAFNDHMQSIFLAGWVSCLDESMSIWTTKWTCPGWMFVPRKPHPKGNEYHSICCSLSGIMYGIEIVEGKDRPRERGRDEYHEKGKTASLLLRLCKPLFATGKVVILDSGFCVLDAILTLKQYGVYSSAIIKKRRYWPKNVPADDIYLYFQDKDIGTCHRLPGELDNIKFDIFAHKEPNYITMLMSTYGACIENANEKESIRSWMENGLLKKTSFYYKQVASNHYLYRGSVDAHNRWRHDGGANQGLSIEETWDTKRWENRVFAFLIAIVEVNAYLAMKQFNGSDEDFITFRKKLAQELIHNKLDEDQQHQGSKTRQKKRPKVEHSLQSIPPYCKFVNGKWKKSYKRKYQQKLCSTLGCKTRTRFYCPCSPTIYRCVECYSQHIIGQDMVHESADVIQL